MNTNFDPEMEQLLAAARRHREDKQRQEELADMIENLDHSSRRRSLPLWIGSAAACAALVVLALTHTPSQPGSAVVPMQRPATPVLVAEAKIQPTVPVQPMPVRRSHRTTQPASIVALPMEEAMPTVVEEGYAAPLVAEVLPTVVPDFDTMPMMPEATPAPARRTIYMRTENTLVAYNSDKTPEPMPIDWKLGSERPEPQTIYLAMND